MKREHIFKIKVPTPVILKDDFHRSTKERREILEIMQDLKTFCAYDVIERCSYSKAAVYNNINYYLKCDIIEQTI